MSRKVLSINPSTARFDISCPMQMTVKTKEINLVNDRAWNKIVY
jgi:hypothetical protein